MPKEVCALFAAIDRELSTTPGVTFRTLAHKLGVDRHEIERTVRQLNGTTFRQLKHLHKLQCGLNALSSGFSVKEASRFAGFQSSAAFSRFIKCATGCTPKDIKQGTSPQPRAT
jgi:methylphosphotriester-DNA--protein-cysteine methyltransferase